MSSSAHQAHLSDSRFVYSWQYLSSLFIFLHCLEVPLRLALGYSPTLWLNLFDIATTIFFAAEIGLQLKVAYIEKGMLVSKPELIRKNYMQTWFTFDLLTTLPYDLLARVLGFSCLADFLRLSRVLRCIKVSQYFKSSNPLLDPPSYIRLIKLSFSFLLPVHWISCAWAQIHPIENVDALTLYNQSIYWAVTTLTTVGYGDISPTTNSSRIFTIFIMIIGVGMYGFIIGNVSTLLVRQDAFKAAKRQKMNDLSNFMLHYRIPTQLQKSVFEFYSYLFTQRLSADDSQIIGDLPGALQNQLRMYINLNLISKVPMFEGTSEACLESLARALKQTIAAPKEKIIQCGDIGNEMFILAHGEVDIKTSEDKHLATLKDGSFFGEMALIHEEKRSAHVVATTYCDLFRLEKADFLKILSEHTDLNEKVQKIMKEREN